MLFLSRCTEGLRHSMEKWTVEKAVGNRDQSESMENDEIDDRMCKKCCDTGLGIIEHIDILQGVAQGCTLPPT